MDFDYGEIGNRCTDAVRWVVGRLLGERAATPSAKAGGATARVCWQTPAEPGLGAGSDSQGRRGGVELGDRASR